MADLRGSLRNPAVLHVAFAGGLDMQDVEQFILWFLENFPTILLTPPISAFTGLALLGWTTHLIGRLIRLR